MTDIDEDEAVQESESVMELNSDLFEIVEHSEIGPAGSYPKNPLATADESASNDEFFDEGPTRTFDRDHLPEQEEPSSPRSEARRAIPVGQPSSPAPAVAAHSKPAAGRQTARPTRPRPKPQPSAGGDIASFQEQPTAVFDDAEMDEVRPRLAARPSAYGARQASESPPADNHSISASLKKALAHINREKLYVILGLVTVFIVAAACAMSPSRPPVATPYGDRCPSLSTESCDDKNRCAHTSKGNNPYRVSTPPSKNQPRPPMLNRPLPVGGR